MNPATEWVQLVCSHSGPYKTLAHCPNFEMTTRTGKVWFRPKKVKQKHKQNSLTSGK